MSKIIRNVSKMDGKLLQSLKQLGCSDKECKFFMACFRLGPSSISDIAARAKLQRSTAYLLAAQLIDKELLSEDFKAYNKRFIAASPQTIVRLLEARKRRLGRLSTDMQENMAELESLYQARESLPQMASYQGPNGLATIWKDILSAKSEILLWTNQETEPWLFAGYQHQQFVNERIKKGLSIRVLAVDNAAGRNLLENDKDLLRETRILPPGINFSAETYLYDDTVTILDYHNNIFGVILKNRLINQAQRSMFEMAWQSSRK